MRRAAPLAVTVVLAAFAFPLLPGQEAPTPPASPPRLTGLFSVGARFALRESNGGLIVTIGTDEELRRLALTAEEQAEYDALVAKSPSGQRLAFPTRRDGESNEEHLARIKEVTEGNSRRTALARKARDARTYEVIAVGEDYVGYRHENGQTVYLPVSRFARVETVAPAPSLE